LIPYKCIQNVVSRSCIWYCKGISTICDVNRIIWCQYRKIASFISCLTFGLYSGNLW